MVKLESWKQKKDTYLLTKDLVRLAIFSKEAIDFDGTTGNINFQVVGKITKTHHPEQPCLYPFFS